MRENYEVKMNELRIQNQKKSLLIRDTGYKQDDLQTANMKMEKLK